LATLPTIAVGCLDSGGASGLAAVLPIHRWFLLRGAPAYKPPVNLPF
jgi:hypothetical protein